MAATSEAQPVMTTDIGKPLSTTQIYRQEVAAMKLPKGVRLYPKGGKVLYEAHACGSTLGIFDSPWDAEKSYRERPIAHPRTAGDRRDTMGARVQSIARQVARESASAPPRTTESRRQQETMTTCWQSCGRNYKRMPLN